MTIANDYARLQNIANIAQSYQVYAKMLKIHLKYCHTTFFIDNFFTALEFYTQLAKNITAHAAFITFIAILVVDQIHAMQKLKFKDLDLQVFIKIVPPLHDELVIVEVSLYHTIKSFKYFPLPLIYSCYLGNLRLSHSTPSIFVWILLASFCHAGQSQYVNSFSQMQNMREMSFTGTQLSIGSLTDQ